MEITNLSISHLIDTTLIKKIDTSESTDSTQFSETLLNERNENQKKIFQQNEDEKNEKMSNTELLDGVTYDPYTDKYTLVLDDYGEKKREFTCLITLDNSTKITSDKPITKEYLEERYEKIQHFLKTEYEDLKKRVNADNGILEDMGISMHGFGQRDSWGIVKIDGEYLDIDADEFKKHFHIYRNNVYNNSINEQNNKSENYNSISANEFRRDNKLYQHSAQEQKNIDENHEISVYYKELNGIEPSFENAEEFEYYAKKEEWKDSHINGMYRRISLAVNLGLIEEGNQTLFPELYQTDKSSYPFRNIENDILSKAVLDSLEKYSGVMEGIMYDVLFGTDDKLFQNNLNEFAKELEDNPSKYPSVNSDFTFTGDINLDENSSQEYKDFITNTLIDFIEKQKSDYVSGNHPIKDPNKHEWSVAYSFDVVANNLKDSIQ